MNSLKIAKLGLASTAALFLIAGCSSTSKNDCTGTNWKSQGVVDGKKGINAEKILKTEETCSKKGVEFPITEYKEGWMEGIAVYCAPENGYEMAKKGKSLNVEVCPIEFRPALEENIKKGKEFAAAEAQMKKLEKQKEKLKEKRENQKEEISKIEGKLENLEEKKSEISIKPNPKPTPDDSEK